MGARCCREDKQNNELKIRKLLLLGGGGSGKTTLFRQLNLLHGEWQKEGISERERCSYKGSIHNNILEAIQMLIAKNNDFSIDNPEFEMNEETKQSAYVMQNLSDNLIDAQLAE